MLLESLILAPNPLLTQFEVCTASYEQSFSRGSMAQVAREKREAVTYNYRMNQENKVSKVYFLNISAVNRAHRKQN